MCGNDPQPRLAASNKQTTSSGEPASSVPATTAADKAGGSRTKDVNQPSSAPSVERAKSPDYIHPDMCGQDAHPRPAPQDKQQQSVSKQASTSTGSASGVPATVSAGKAGDDRSKTDANPPSVSPSDADASAATRDGGNHDYLSADCSSLSASPVFSDVSVSPRRRPSALDISSDGVHGVPASGSLSVPDQDARRWSTSDIGTPRFSDIDDEIGDD